MKTEEIVKSARAREAKESLNPNDMNAAITALCLCIDRVHEKLSHIKDRLAKLEKQEHPE